VKKQKRVQQNIFYPWLPPFFYSAANKLDLAKKARRVEGINAAQA
jgi:hypothetical protein